MKSITPEELIEEFEELDPWQRNSEVVEYGKKLEPMPAEFKIEENRVHGCQSMLWVVLRLEPGPTPTVRLIADSDGQIVRGLVAILSMLCLGRTPTEVAALDLEGTFERLGLKKFLTPSRANGFYSMVKRIRRLAAEHAEA